MNLNPSSPAAEHASDYVEKAMIAATEAAAAIVEKAKVDADAVSAKQKDKERALERMSRSEEIAPGKKGRKSVRIQSPPRIRDDSSLGSTSGSGSRTLVAPFKAMTTHSQVNSAGATAPPVSEADEDVEEEARRIIELLGPDVVSTDLPGMATSTGPNGVTQLSSGSQQRRYRDVAQRSAAAEPDTGADAQAQKFPPKPPVGREVVERITAKPAATAASKKQNGGKVSAFKRGFLSRPPPVSSSPTAAKASIGDSASTIHHAGPRVSLGMSALDRASRTDEPLEEQREAQGLTRAVPHARPSKAYAEKLRKRAEEQASGAPPTTDEDRVAGSKPHGSSDVRFAGVEVIGAEKEDEAEEEANEEAEPLDIDEDDEYEAAHLAFDSDDEDSYDSGDLDALRPELDEADIDWDLDSQMDEVRQEYARAKAALLQHRGEHQHSLTGAGRDEAAGAGWRSDLVSADAHEEGEGVVVSKSGAAADKAEPKASRFKQDRMARAFGTFTHAQSRAQQKSRAHDETAAADEAGHDLVHLLQDARNLGPDVSLPDATQMDANITAPRPVMVIPQIAPVRFAPGGVPVDEAMLRSKQGVELDGESDDEDARLTEIAKQRFGLDAAAGKEAQAGRAAEHVDPAHRRPPIIGPSSSRKATPQKKEAPAEQGEPPIEEEPAPAPAKKVSRFKAARMAGGI